MTMTPLSTGPAVDPAFGGRGIAESSHRARLGGPGVDFRRWRRRRASKPSPGLHVAELVVERARPGPHRGRDHGGRERTGCDQPSCANEPHACLSCSGAPCRIQRRIRSISAGCQHAARGRSRHLVADGRWVLRNLPVEEARRGVAGIHAELDAVLSRADTDEIRVRELGREHEAQRRVAGRMASGDAAVRRERLLNLFAEAHVGVAALLHGVRVVVARLVAGAHHPVERGVGRQIGHEDARGARVRSRDRLAVVLGAGREPLEHVVDDLVGRRHRVARGRPGEASPCEHPTGRPPRCSPRRSAASGSVDVLVTQSTRFWSSFPTKSRARTTKCHVVACDRPVTSAMPLPCTDSTGLPNEKPASGFASKMSYVMRLCGVPSSVATDHVTTAEPALSAMALAQPDKLRRGRVGPGARARRRGVRVEVAGGVARADGEGVDQARIVEVRDRHRCHAGIGDQRRRRIVEARELVAHVDEVDDRRPRACDRRSRQPK